MSRDDDKLEFKVSTQGCGGCLVTLGLLIGTVLMLREGWQRGWLTFAATLVGCGFAWLAWGAVARALQVLTVRCGGRGHG